MTENGTNLLPLEEEHCTAVEVTEEEVQNSVKLITSLSTVVSCSSSPLLRWVILLHRWLKPPDNPNNAQVEELTPQP